MNVYHIIGAILVIAIIAIWWFMDRLKKRIARRCRRENCGRTDVERIRKIILASDENISFRSPAGKRRWFIRRVVKLTFTACECKWVELVKIDTDPISVWHALWVQRFQKEQYQLEGWPLIDAAERKFRQLYLSGGGRRLAASGGSSTDLDPQASDTPPISLESLFRDYFKEFSEMLNK
jgi:hypothetical protein